MRGEKLKIIKDVLGHSYQSGHEHLFYCPFCDHHKMKLSVNVDKSVFKCWICDKSGHDLGYLVRKFGTRQNRDEWAKFDDQVEITDFDFLFKVSETPVEQRIDLPGGFTSLTGKTRPASSWSAYRYLAKRGVVKEDILKWKIGFCSEGEYSGRIIVPSFNKNGYVNYFIARSYGYEWPRYKNPPASRDIIFNELYINWNEDIIIVEGVFDAIKAGNAIPLLGSTLRDGSAFLETLVKNNSTVYLALDEDASKKSRSIAGLLLRYGLNIYEINTSGFEDVGEMTKEEFRTRKENASFIERDNYLLQKLFAL
jgi:transcription elongation factor Elf1